MDLFSNFFRYISIMFFIIFINSVDRYLKFLHVCNICNFGCVNMASGGFKGGPALMIAKRGPTPKKKDRNCKEQGPRRCFWP